jgi:hypothetical protein
MFLDLLTERHAFVCFLYVKWLSGSIVKALNSKEDNESNEKF